MEKKAFKNNAQPITGVARSLLGFFILGLFLFVLGWAFSSFTMGLLVFCLVVCVIPLTQVLVNRFRFFGPRAKRESLNWKTQPELADFYLHLKLWKPGPSFEIWLRDDLDLGFLYLGVPLGLWNKEVLLVTPSWLALPLDKKKQDIENLWSCLTPLSLFEKRILGLQMALWYSAFFPLAQLVAGFQMVFESIGFRELPPLALWVQMPLRKLKSIWFGDSPSLQEKWFQLSSQSDSQSQRGRFQARRSRISAKKSIIEWGPWVFENTADRHPVWELLTKDL